jgi:putative oxidoreductase
MSRFSEAVGCIFLPFGIQTSMASFSVMCTIFAAIFIQQWNKGTWMISPAMRFRWVSVYTLRIGSGRVGTDHLLTKNKV